MTSTSSLLGLYDSVPATGASSQRCPRARFPPPFLSIFFFLFLFSLTVYSEHRWIKSEMSTSAFFFHFFSFFHSFFFFLLPCTLNTGGSSQRCQRAHFPEPCPARGAAASLACRVLPGMRTFIHLSLSLSLSHTHTHTHYMYIYSNSVIQ